MFSRISNILIACIMLIVLVGVLQASAATEEEMLAIWQDMKATFDAHDAAGWITHFTDDAVYDYVPAPPPIEGKAAIAEWISGLFQAFPDIRGESQRTFASGNIVVDEYTVSATQEGEWMGIPATGNSGQVAHLSIVEFEGDKVKRITTYVDNVTVLVELGVMPPSDLPDLTPSFTLPDPEPTGLAPMEADAELITRWSPQNLEDWMKRLHPDAVFRYNTVGLIPLNREQTLALNEIFAQSDSALHGEIVRQYDLGDGWVASESIWRGISDGPYLGVPPTNTPLELRAASVGHYDADGLVTEFNFYFDNLTVLIQRGAFPPPTPPEQMLAVHDAIATALANQDLEALGEAWADDIVYNYVPAPAPLEGKEAVQEFFADVFQTFPDFYTDEGQVWVGDGLLVTEHAAYGTQLGVFENMVPPTGNFVTIPHLDIAEYEGNKVKHIASYLDVVGMLIQMGAMPAPEMPPLEPSFTLPDPEPTGLAPLDAYAEQTARWNSTDLAHWAQMMRPDGDFFVSPLGIPMDRDAYIAAQELYLLAFPDRNQENIRVIDLGDGWVLAEVVFTATNNGPYFGIPATGLPTVVRGGQISHFDADGLLTYQHTYFDNLTVLTQIGVFPPPPDKETIRALARRGFEDIWNQKNLGAIDELVTPDFVLHQPAGIGDMVGPIAFKQFVASYLIAFPDINFEIHDIAVEGDLAAVRWTAYGTHLGPFMGIPPSGREGPGTTGISITRFENGKQVESWNEWDALGLMGWLGVIPTEHELFQWGEPSPITGDPGDPEANKAVVMRFAEEVFNQKKLDVVDEIHHPDAIGHDPNVSPMEDTAQMKQVIGAYHIAFPDFHVTNDALIAEGDRVVGRWTVTATHQGDFFGIPATGKPVQWTAINMFRFADGKIAESWWAYDALGILQQLGVVPTGPPEDFSNVFFLSLEQGLNMVSLPLKSITPYTARSFAEYLSSTVVIKLDEKRQRFVGFTLDAPDDGFAIEGGKGYIVNVPESRVVAFVGAAWTNQPPVEEAAPIFAQSDAAWAFVVSGRLEGNVKDGYLVTVKNTRTNAVTTDVVRSGYFAAAFADLNRRDVVQSGDRLEVQVRDRAGEIASDTLPYTVTPESIRQAVLPVVLKQVGVPNQTVLLQNYPNPFNPETWIPYQIREPAEVVIRIYNSNGQLVRTLSFGQRAAGFYLGHTRAAYWDGRNERGERVGSGVYFYHLRAGDFSATRRMLIVK